MTSLNFFCGDIIELVINFGYFQLIFDDFEYNCFQKYNCVFTLGHILYFFVQLLPIVINEEPHITILEGGAVEGIE